MIVSRSLITCGSVCVINFGGCWDSFCSLVKFTYNNMYHLSVEMIPLIHGKGGYIGIFGWFEVGDVKSL